MNTNLRRQLVTKFRNKEYRDAFVAEQIYSRIPLKIRAMRDRRGLSQRQLGGLAGVKQEWVSKLEDPSYGRLTLSTLLKIASAFDCGLSVDFVPFSRILNDAIRLSPNSFDVRSFAEDTALDHAPAIVPPIPVGNLGVREYFHTTRVSTSGNIEQTDTIIPLQAGTAQAGPRMTIAA